MEYRLLLWLLVLVLGTGALFPAAAHATDGTKTAADRVTRAGEAPDTWNVQASIGHLPSAGLHGPPADAGITDYRLKMVRNIPLNDQLTLSLGAGYGLKHIDASSAALLPPDLHAVFAEAGARYRINDRSFASIKLYPGFYSDFREIGDDDLRMPVLALGGYSFDNGVSVVGGLVYRFGYHASRFIPALGFSYQPDDNWRIDLIAPRPGITYLASRQLHLFAAGDFASDEYELKDRSSGAKAIKYSDYKVMGGVNYLPTSAVKISASIGYAFERKFAFYDGTRPDMRVDDVPFVKISLEMGW